MRSIVSDTGPLLHLQEVNALELARAAGSVKIPPAVAEEWRALDPQGAEGTPWVQIVALPESGATLARSFVEGRLLDRGEAEAMVLAELIEADWFLTDDAAARFLAARRGLEVHGSLGVVLWAAAVGKIDQQSAEDFLERLGKSSLWISARVLAEARSAVVSLFAT